VDEKIADRFFVFSGLEMGELGGEGNRTTPHLLVSQIGRFLLAGGASVNVVNVGKESTNRIDVNCSRKECRSCLMVNPSPGRMSPMSWGCEGSGISHVVWESDAGNPGASET